MSNSAAHRIAWEIIALADQELHGGGDNTELVTKLWDEAASLHIGSDVHLIVTHWSDGQMEEITARIDGEVQVISAE
jgi:hypothetical protein